MYILYGLLFTVAIHRAAGVSTKLEFGEDDVVPQQTDDESDDVEVQHTIVLSTKLKNNRAGIHTNDRDGTSPLTQNIEVNKNKPKHIDGDVPVVKGYKSVETTRIRNPNVWYRRQDRMYPGLQNENPSFTMYPEIQTYLLDGQFYDSTNNQWKPSSFFNNINQWNNDDNHHNPLGRNDIDRQNKFHRTIADNSVKEFYCNKCREMNKGLVNNCGQPSVRTTTPKNKIDGKLLKLN